MMKPPDSPPSWYCDFKVPHNVISTFQPLVYLVGLDVQNHPIHRSFWEVFIMKHSQIDFQPKYVNVNLDHKLREKKVKSQESMDCYIPRGILKSNWIRKHTEEIPSAVVAFFDMNWCDPQWTERKLELARQIKFLKMNLAPHGTQILVMLMKPAGCLDDHFTTDRASAFCAAAEIPPKHLFVLAYTNVERIQTCVQRLEMGMREISKAYYSTRLKKVRGWKDKVTLTPLVVRYNFKIGFFQEIKKDFIAAITHYQSAFEALLTIKATDANVQEVKVVASVLTYRLCRIQLSKGDGKEAKNQFDKHIRSFVKIEGNKELLFEHFAWLSQQYYQFGELLKQHASIFNIPDSVFYFISAGKYMEKRRDTFKQSVVPSGKVLWPPEMNPYNGLVQVKLYCIGQRPWWNNPFSQDYLYAIEDENTILALKYFESLCKHSEYIITDWGMASEVCRENHRMRSRCQLMSMMGTEFLRTKLYSQCIMWMTHVLREFGQEEWNNIIFDVANCGFYAAFFSGDIAAYCNFLLILLKLDITHLVPIERQSLLWSNFICILNGIVPVPVDENIDFNRSAWEKGLSDPSWTSYVEIHSHPILECKVFFKDDVTSVTDNAKIQFILTNNSSFTITVQKYGVRMNPTDYNSESHSSVSIQPHESQELELYFKPLSRDISKHAQIQVAYVDIGRPNRSVLLHYSLIRASNIYLWTDDVSKTKKGGSSFVRIDQSKPLIKIHLTCPNPVLVNEWYKVIISVTNTDTKDYDKMSFLFQLQTPDPQHAFLTSDPVEHKSPGSLLHISEMSKLVAGQSADIFVYVKTTVHLQSDFKLFTKVKYMDHYGQSLTSEHLEELKVLPPFAVTQTITDLHNVTLDTVVVNEAFIIKSTITNTSNTKLRISSSSYDITLPTFEFNGGTSSLDVILNSNEEATCIVVLSALDTGLTLPGSLNLTWNRESEAKSLDNTSQILIIPITVLVDNSLYVKASFSNDGHGKLKHPIQGFFTLVNRSNTVFDLMILMDSTESFMNAGPKRLSVKLYGRETYTFNYVLFPLVTGLIETPKLSFFTPPNGSTVLEPIGLSIHQSSPKTLFITA